MNRLKKATLGRGSFRGPQPQFVDARFEEQRQHFLSLQQLFTSIHTQLHSFKLYQQHHQQQGGSSNNNNNSSSSIKTPAKVYGLPEPLRSFAQHLTHLCEYAEQYEQEQQQQRLYQQQQQQQQQLQEEQTTADQEQTQDLTSSTGSTNSNSSNNNNDSNHNNNTNNNSNKKGTTSRQFVTEIMDTVEIVKLAIDDFTATCSEFYYSVEDDLEKISAFKKKIIERDEGLVKYETMVKALAEKPPKAPEALEKEEVRVQQQHKLYKQLNDSLINEIAQYYNRHYYEVKEKFNQLLVSHIMLFQTIHRSYQQLLTCMENDWHVPELSPPVVVWRGKGAEENGGVPSSSLYPSRSLDTLVVDTWFGDITDQPGSPSAPFPIVSSVVSEVPRTSFDVSSLPALSPSPSSPSTSRPSSPTPTVTSSSSSSTTPTTTSTTTSVNNCIPTSTTLLCNVCKRRVQLEFVDEHSKVCSEDSNNNNNDSNNNDNNSNSSGSSNSSSNSGSSGSNINRDYALAMTLPMFEKAWKDNPDQVRRMFDRRNPNALAIKSFIRKEGLPTELRKKVWPLIAGIEEKKGSGENPSYQELLETFGKVTSEATYQIDKDLRRTFPHEPLIQNEETIEKLRRVLTVYSFVNPSIGYCQSMNFIAAVLLVHLSEEDAFWTLKTIIEDMLPANYYTATMSGLIVEQHVFKYLLDLKFPQITTHLRKLMFDINPVIVQWFLCLFVSILPLEPAVRVLEIFLFEGDKFLFRLGLSLFKLNEKALLKTTEFGDAFMLLQNISSLTSPAALIQKAFEIKIPKAKISSLRDMYLPKVLREREEFERMYHNNNAIVFSPPTSPPTSPPLSPRNKHRAPSISAAASLSPTSTTTTTNSIPISASPPSSPPSSLSTSPPKQPTNTTTSNNSSSNSSGSSNISSNHNNKWLSPQPSPNRSAMIFKLARLGLRKLRAEDVKMENEHENDSDSDDQHQQHQQQQLRSVTITPVASPRTSLDNNSNNNNKSPYSSPNRTPTTSMHSDSDGPTVAATATTSTTTSTTSPPSSPTDTTKTINENNSNDTFSNNSDHNNYDNLNDSAASDDSLSTIEVVEVKTFTVFSPTRKNSPREHVTTTTDTTQQQQS